MPSNADPSFQAAASTVSNLVTKASKLCTSCGSANVAGLINAVSSLPGRSPDADSTAGPLTTDGSTPKVPVDQSVLPDVPKINAEDLAAVQSPSPTAGVTQDAPKVTKLTDPLVGALIGDDDQQGVVPKLLDNLLKPGP